MSIESLTGDEFMRLLPDEHREALQQYNTTIASVASDVAGLVPGTPEHDQALDKLSRLACLRKVHKVRLAEMVEDEPPVSKMGAGSYGATPAIAA